MINSRRETTKTMAEYEIENKHLKDMVDQLSLRVSQMEKVNTCCNYKDAEHTLMSNRLRKRIVFSKAVFLNSVRTCLNRLVELTDLTL